MLETLGAIAVLLALAILVFPDLLDVIGEVGDYGFEMIRVKLFKLPLRTYDTPLRVWQYHRDKATGEYIPEVIIEHWHRPLFPELKDK